MFRSITRRIALSVALSGLLIVTARCGVVDTPTGQEAARQTSADYPEPPATAGADGQALAAGAYPPFEATKLALDALPAARVGTPGPKAQVAPSIVTPGPSPTPITPFLTPLAGGGTLVMNGQTPFSSRELIGENKWFIDVGDTRYVVYAGKQVPEGEPPNPIQGALIVEVKTISTQVYQPMMTYLTPARTGSAHIVDANTADGALLLTIATADGTRYTFDVRSGKFQAK